MRAPVQSTREQQLERELEWLERIITVLMQRPERVLPKDLDTSDSFDPKVRECYILRTALKFLSRNATDLEDRAIAQRALDEV